MKSKKLTTLLIALFFLTGISLMLYPAVSDAWNSLHQSRAIETYSERVAELNDFDYERLWADAEEYNRRLAGKEADEGAEALREQYEALLNVSGNGMMGYVEIPSIHTALPIYHGTDEAVLQIAVGHLEGSSLPVGGEGTHCVLSSHRGLPSARLFTDLDKLEEGEVFLLHVLGETLAYKVDQILVVEPDETEALSIEEDRDYCTLVTCTPYGVNSHRLLVRGCRTEYEKQEEDVQPVEKNAYFDLLELLPWAVVLVLLALLFCILTGRQNRKRKREKGKEETGG